MEFRDIEILPTEYALSEFAFDLTIGSSFEKNFFNDLFKGVDDGIYKARYKDKENLFIIKDDRVIFIKSLPVNENKFNHRKNNPLLEIAEKIISKSESEYFRQLGD